MRADLRTRAPQHSIYTRSSRNKKTKQEKKSANKQTNVQVNKQANIRVLFSPVFANRRSFHMLRETRSATSAAQTHENPFRKPNQRQCEQRRNKREPINKPHAYTSSSTSLSTSSRTPSRTSFRMPLPSGTPSDTVSRWRIRFASLNALLRRGLISEVHSNRTSASATRSRTLVTGVTRQIPFSDDDCQ